jgi:hypothetical protein
MAQTMSPIVAWAGTSKTTPQGMAALAMAVSAGVMAKCGASIALQDQARQFVKSINFIAVNAFR